MAESTSIDVGPVWARLRGPADQLRLLRDTFTLDTPGAEFMKWGDGKTRFVKRGDVILSGLTWRAAQTLVSGGHPKPVIRWPLILERPPLTTKAIALRDYQESTVQKMIRVRRVFVQSPTGSGKTEIGIEAVRRIGRKTLWLTHRTELMKQTVKRFKDRIDIECGILGGGRDRDSGDVVVAMVPTLARMMNPKTGVPEVVKTWLATFECVVGDEGHHGAAKSWQDVFEGCVNANYRFCLSATADTGNPVSNWKIEGATGPTWTVTGIMELANRGFLARPHVMILSVPASTYPSYEEIRELVCPDWRENPMALRTLGATLFRETYERGIMNNAARNTEVVTTAVKHAVAKEKVLVLCSRVPHAADLAAITRDAAKVPVWVLDGGCDDLTRTVTLNLFKRGSGGGILYATPFFREGIDLPQIDVGVLAGGGLSDTGVIQGLGRVLRPNRDEVLWYDFDDGGAPTERPDKDYLAQHSRSRIDLYSSLKFKVERA